MKSITSRRIAPFYLLPELSPPVDHVRRDRVRQVIQRFEDSKKQILLRQKGLSRGRRNVTTDLSPETGDYRLHKHEYTAKEKCAHIGH